MLKNEVYLPPVLIDHIKGISTLNNLRFDARDLKEYIKEGRDEIYMCNHLGEVIPSDVRGRIFRNVINRSIAVRNIGELFSVSGLKMDTNVRYVVESTIESYGFRGFVTIAKSVATQNALFELIVNEHYEPSTHDMDDVLGFDVGDDRNSLRLMWLDKLIAAIDERLKDANTDRESGS